MLYTRDRGEKQEDTKEDLAVLSDDTYSLPGVEFLVEEKSSVSSDSDLPSDISLETTQKCLEVRTSVFRGQDNCVYRSGQLCSHKPDQCIV